MPTLEQRVARHDREIAEIRRLLLLSAAQHVAARKEMRETRQAHKEDHAIAMREIRRLEKLLAGAFDRRGNGHEKRRLQ